MGVLTWISVNVYVWSNMNSFLIWCWIMFSRCRNGIWLKLTKCTTYVCSSKLWELINHTKVFRPKIYRTIIQISSWQLVCVCGGDIFILILFFICTQLLNHLWLNPLQYYDIETHLQFIHRITHENLDIHRSPYIYCTSRTMKVFTSLDVLTFSSHRKTWVFAHLSIPLFLAFTNSTLDARHSMQMKQWYCIIPFENFLSKISFVAFRSSTKQTNKWKLKGREWTRDEINLISNVLISTITFQTSNIRPFYFINFWFLFVIWYCFYCH